MTQRKIRIGIQIQPQHASYANIRDAVFRAEELGVDIVFNWDHFYPLTGDPDGAHFECWTMLGAWAEQTENVQFGALVTGGGYRNPDLLADMARTVDHISGGRLILGLGAGWFEKDYDNYGYVFGTAGSRLDLFGEFLPRITSRLQVLNPPAVGQIPILIGGGGEKKTLRYVAEYANIWHSFGDAATLRRKTGILAGHCERAGREITEIELSCEISRRYTDADLDELADLGVSLFTMGISGPDYDFSAIANRLAWRDRRNSNID